MASRTTAALPMECTGGFKALRNHVKLTKDVGAEKSTPAPQGTEREQEWDDAKQLDPLECHNGARQNQERTSQEEHHLNTIRLALAKEQREIKTRERSVRAMEAALQDAMDRTADKEQSLDQRIQDIARLEQRLHDALAQKSPPAAAEPQQDISLTNQAHQALEDIRCKLEERETSLALREQELAMARDRVADRERHLATKERVLRDKAAELNHLQSEIEKKDAQRAAAAAQLIDEREHELQRRYEAHEQELIERFRQQLTDLTAEFEVKQAQLDERITAAKEESEDRSARLIARAEAIDQAEKALEESLASLKCQQESLLLAELAAKTATEEAVNRASALELERAELAKRIEEAQDTRCRFEEAEAKLKQQEAKLALFAAEVESQARDNAAQRRQLEDDRIAFDTRVVAAARAPTPSVHASESVATSEAPTETPSGQVKPKPARSRSFTAGLFRSKSTMRT